MASLLVVYKTTCLQTTMDGQWMNKFEPMMDSLLKTEVRISSGRLNFYMSKLNLEEHKTIVFDALTEMHYCDCCSKHQLDKPCIPAQWVSNKRPTFSVINCECDCRHVSRMICRMCD